MQTEPRLPFLFACASFQYAPQDMVPHRLCIICSADWNFSAFAPRYCAARQGYPHEFSTIRPRFPQSYPQERELSSTFVSKTAAKCGKLRNLAVYRLVYVWISLWIMWKNPVDSFGKPRKYTKFRLLLTGFSAISTFFAAE